MSETSCICDGDVQYERGYREGYERGYRKGFTRALEELRGVLASRGVVLSTASELLGEFERNKALAGDRNKNTINSDALK